MKGRYNTYIEYIICIEFKIYTYYNIEKNKENKELKDNLINFINKAESAANCGEKHVVIEIEEFFFHTYGIVSPLEMQFNLPERIELSITQLEDLCKSGQWNSIFDRECIPDMQKIINTISEEYVEFLSGKEYIFPEGKKLSKHTGIERQKQSMMRLQGSNPISMLAQILNMSKGHESND